MSALAIPGDGGGDEDSDDEQLLDQRPEELAEREDIKEKPEKILEICKKRIKKLIEERERKSEYHERLEKKLRKLESELAKSRQDVEQTERQLKMLKTKGQEDERKSALESSKMASRQAEHIRESLSEVLYTKPRNAPGKGTYELDTVKVAYKKDRDSMVWYNLQFRCDNTTTVKQLRKNVCNYWEIKDQDYILKTMGNNKCNEDIELKDCFKNGEIAMLRLEQKDTKNSDPPGEDELKAIQAKKPQPRQRKGSGESYNPSKAAAQVHGAQDGYRSQLEKLGGTYFLLRMQEDKPTEHVSKINLRDIIVYTAILVFTVIVYGLRRPERVEYCFVRSIEEQLMSTWSRPSDHSDPDMFTQDVPSFRDLQSHEDLWDWLNGTLPGVIWDTSVTGMGTYNLLLGYLSIRTQSIGSSGTCLDGQGDVVGRLQQLTPSAGCFGMLSYGQNEETLPMIAIRNYWENQTSSAGGIEGLIAGQEVTSNIRGSANPGVWVNRSHNEANHGTGWLEGKLSTDYDASGYSVNYRMMIDTIALAPPIYKQDLQFFRNEGWISDKTRVVIVSFTLYNFHYDLWMAIDLIAELPPSGAVVTSYYIRPFNQRNDETMEELEETYMDWARLVGALYILFYVGYTEMKHKTRNHKAGYKYYTSLNGVTDVGIVLCIFVVIFWRWTLFQGSMTTADYVLRVNDQDGVGGYQSYSNKAQAYESIFIVEGCLMVFLTYRMLSFLRLNSTVYLLWVTLGRAFREFVYFLLIFFPLLFGAMLYLHRMYGQYVPGFETLTLTTVQVYRLLEGNLPVQNLVDRDPLRALLILALFYISLSFFMLNVFVTIVVDAYYVTRLTALPGPSWGPQKWMEWATPGLCLQLSSAAKDWSKNEGTIND
jgi:hypothetical protein